MVSCICHWIYFCWACTSMRYMAMKIVFAGNGTYPGIVHVGGMWFEELFCKEPCSFVSYSMCMGLMTLD